MVLDYAGRKTSNKKPKSKLVGILVIAACLIIIALLILLLVKQHQRRSTISIKTQTTTHKIQKKAKKHSKHKVSTPLTQKQPKYDFYTLLPKMSATPSQHK